VSNPGVLTCAACGAAGSGNFCSSCGTPRAGAKCASCGASLTAGERFCSSCGHGVAEPVGRLAAVPPRDRTPWIVAGVSLAGTLGLLLFTLARQAPVQPVAMSGAAGGAVTAGESPPDLSTMSPRERFNRLYNRVMQAAQAGDEATVSRFSPMALGAYQMLDSLDADAQYHAALIRAHTGEVEAARALGDSILTRTPGHLLGYVVLGTAARWRKDDKALQRAYRAFLAGYDAEMKANRPEYAEHRFSIEEFRRAAQGASGAAGS